MKDFGKLLLSIGVFGYLFYLILLGIYNAFGIESTLVILTSIMVLICTFYVITLYRKASLVHNLFKGIPVEHTEKRHFNFDLTQKINSTLASVPAFFFGNRTYKRDEAMAIYVFVGLVISGLIYLIKIVSVLSWN